MDIVPDFANIEDENGNIEEVDPDDVEIGSTIVIKPGEKVPLDGIVIDGQSSLDTKALTGESVPKDVREGSEIYSGSINLNGLLKIKTTKEFGESTVTKVLELIEDASERKSKSENFITKFARIYTPVVVYLALALAFLPGIFSFLMGNSPNFSSWIYRALIFLIISCPCALVISIPLSFFAGIGSASKKGILVKGSNYMEVLSNVDQIIFDKTGTLTKGTFEVTAVHPEKLSKEEAGRKLRYDFFNKIATSKAKIALAHNFDDNMETILFRIIRGTGISGLRGIPYKRDNIIRPLLDTKRQTIEEELKKLGIPWMLDETNLTNDYSRNMLRNELIPFVEKNFNTSFKESLNLTPQKYMILFLKKLKHIQIKII